MVMLPDYPVRVVAKHRGRVDRASLVCQFLLISLGAGWIFSSFGSETSYLERFGPGAILFSSALIMPDLVEFGPIQRTRISTACCIAWPPILAFACTVCNLPNDPVETEEPLTSAMFFIVPVVVRFVALSVAPLKVKSESSVNNQLVPYIVTLPDV